MHLQDDGKVRRADPSQFVPDLINLCVLGTMYVKCMIALVSVMSLLENVTVK